MCLSPCPSPPLWSGRSCTWCPSPFLWLPGQGVVWFLECVVIAWWFLWGGRGCRANKQSWGGRLITSLIKISTRCIICQRFLPDLVFTVVVTEWFFQLLHSPYLPPGHCSRRKQRPLLPVNLTSVCCRNELMGSWALTGLQSLLYLIISVLGLPQSASSLLVMTKSAKLISRLYPALDLELVLSPGSWFPSFWG